MVRTLRLAALLLLTLLWATSLCTASAISYDTSPTANPQHAQSPQEIGANAIITVTTTSDELNNDGDCSLREAIHAADTDAPKDNCPAGNGGDTINLPAGLFLLATSHITLTGTITLQGSLSDTTILDGQLENRVLYIASGATVTLRHLEITHGRPWLEYDQMAEFAAEGGGILNFGTTLLADRTVHDNRASHTYVIGNINEPADGAPGGGIFNQGIMTITNSTISGNSGGNTYLGVGGSPHWGHETGGEGGGIANGGTLTLDYVTLTNNRPGHLGAREDLPIDPNLIGGIYNQGGTVTIKNSILAGNLGRECGGALISTLGYTLIGNPAWCAIAGPFVQWTAHLGPLQDNGGPTPTHALDAKSPAIDAGNCTDSRGMTVATDQRGAPRPQGATCDIGAYESPYTSTFASGEIHLPQIEYHPFPCTDIRRACNLTNYAGGDNMPHWSPDGNQILFWRTTPGGSPDGGGIYVMNADGTAPTQLANFGEVPQWSPDGSRIAFRGWVQGQSDIFVMDRTGENLTNLTNTPDISEYALEWSPDGTKLLFQLPISGQTGNDLYVIGVDGSEKIRLATNSLFVSTPWSPDGRQVAFEDGTDSWKMKVVNSDGANPIDVSAALGVAVESISWSPDGSKIAFTCTTRIANRDEYRLCVTNRDLTGLQEFSSAETWYLGPVWSPDSSKIAYICSVATVSDRDICLMNRDGSGNANLTQDADTSIGGILWSPDSSKLLFRREFLPIGERVGPSEIMVVNLDGTLPRRLTNTPIGRATEEPAWAPDSRKIVYTSNVSGNWEIYLLGIDP